MGVAKIATPNPHGKTTDNTQLSPTNYYNLDAIISVGYRVNSIQATQFRIWATNILKEYMIKGFAMDEVTQIRKWTRVAFLYALLERLVSVGWNIGNNILNITIKNPA